MARISHSTYHVDTTGRVERVDGSLPGAVAASLPPLRVTVVEGIDARAAVGLLRHVADEIERQGEATP